MALYKKVIDRSMTIFEAVIQIVIDRSMTILLGLEKVSIWPFINVIDRSMTIFTAVIKKVIDRSMTIWGLEKVGTVPFINCH